MYLYLLMVRAHSSLRDFSAAAALLRECYQAECRGPGYGLGLVYATDRRISDDDAKVLGVVEWV